MCPKQSANRNTRLIFSKNTATETPLGLSCERHVHFWRFEEPCCLLKKIWYNRVGTWKSNCMTGLHYMRGEKVRHPVRRSQVSYFVTILDVQSPCWLYLGWQEEIVKLYIVIKAVLIKRHCNLSICNSLAWKSFKNCPTSDSIVSNTLDHTVATWTEVSPVSDAEVS